MKFTSNVVSSLAATSAMVGTFKEKHITPMVDQAGKAIESFKEERLVPGFVEMKDVATSAAKASGNWAYDQAGKTIETFKENHAVPVLDQAGKIMGTFKEEGFVPGLVEIRNTATTGAKAAGSLAYEHPFQTAWYALSVATTVSPGIVAAPVVYVTGYGIKGVRAGSIAAKYQSTVGNVVAPGVFATLESYAMRGYGVAVVNGATRAVAAGSGAVVGGVSWVKQRLGGDEDAETQQDDVEVEWKPKAKL